MCSCMKGFTGKLVDQCSSAPCVNGACLNLVDGFRCVCDASFSGFLCDIDIEYNYCVSNLSFLKYIMALALISLETMCVTVP